MGVILKNVGSIKVNNVNYEIEMNWPILEGQGANIHIQSDLFRIDLTQREFFEVAACVILAKRQLIKIKEGK